MLSTLFHPRLSANRSRSVPLRLSVLALIIALLGACANLNQYDVTFNERSLYSPQSLFDDYRISDPALANCVAQAIKDFEVYTASGLETLNCSEAGISSLLGLAIFTELKRLKVSSNNIRNLVELSRLKHLIEVQLDGNRIVDSVPISALPALTLANFSNNPELQCHSLALFKPETKVIRPEHCQ